MLPQKVPHRMAPPQMMKSKGMLSKDNVIYISKILSSQTVLEGQIEFEAKFGYFTNGGSRFVSSVPFKRFNALKQKLAATLPSKQQHITDYITDSSIRKQVISEEGKPEKIIWQRKERLEDFPSRKTRRNQSRREQTRNQQFYDYGIRISISAETEIAPIVDFRHSYIRVKDRTSFFIEEFIRIDLTTVKAHPGDGPKHECKDKDSYEVEIELLNWCRGNLGKRIVSFSVELEKVFQNLYDTVNLFTVNEKRSLASFINNKLGEKRGSALRFDMVAQARNLKYRDMVWGGLVGNEMSKNGKIVQNRYSVTHKADGKRKFLAVDKTGIWLIFPPHEFNLVYRFTRENQDNSLDGLLLDGELVPNDPQHRKSMNDALRINEDVAGLHFFDVRDRKKLRLFPSAKYWFLVFDALMIDGNKDIQDLPHSERMNRAYEAVNRLEDVADNDRLMIHFKAFKQIATPEEFYIVMQRMFGEKGALPYAEDGFIFMSEMAAYNPIRRTNRELLRERGYKLKLSERSLVKQADICKWKPIERLTIDFCIEKKRDGTIKLLAMKGMAEYVPFTGTKNNPFDASTMVDVDHPMLQYYPTGSIIEFKWDFDRHMFTPLLPRPDKQKPNRLEIAIDDWNDIHNPITQQVLTGKNFTLMRKYHSRIKRQLFQSVLNRGAEFLLDIGSGRGGDVSKWQGFAKIVAVEPNADHIKELERRIEKNGLTDRVRIVQAGGEDTEVITAAVKEFIGTRVHIVSMMLSMTFFWKNKSTLRRLVNTVTTNLDDEGEIVFMTMDGDTVEEVFDPFFYAMKTGKLIFHQTTKDRGYATLELEPQEDVKIGNGRKALVYIQDSIVGKAEVQETLKPKGRQSPTAEVRFIGIPIIRSRKLKEQVEFTEIPILFSQGYQPPKKIVPQEEYLVHLTDFESMLSETRSIVGQSVYRADREPFLTEAEKDFSLMYSFGSYDVTGSNRFSFEHAYSEWKVINDIIHHFYVKYSQYDGYKLLSSFRTFLRDLTQEIGGVFEGAPDKPKYIENLDAFEVDLKAYGISPEDAMAIRTHVALKINEHVSDPYFWKFADEYHVREIPEENVIYVGEAYFKLLPERMAYLKDVLKNDFETKRLGKIMSMLLKNFTNMPHGLDMYELPKRFVQNVAEKWPENFILEANVTPLTTHMPLLENGYAQQQFTSYFYPEDKYFGSLGRIEDVKLFQGDEERFTTIISFNIPSGFSALSLQQSKLLLKALAETSSDNFLRVIYFIEKRDAEDGFARDIEASNYLVYDTDIMLRMPYRVYILESSHNPSETYEELFEDLEIADIEQLGKVLTKENELLERLPREASLHTEFQYFPRDDEKECTNVQLFLDYMYRYIDYEDYVKDLEAFEEQETKDISCLSERDLIIAAGYLEPLRALTFAAYHDLDEVIEEELGEYEGPKDKLQFSFMTAIKYGNLQAVKVFMKDKRIDPSREASEAIIRASSYGHIDIVKLLLKDGRADPGAVNNAAIEYASKNGHADVVRLLLKDPRVNPRNDALIYAIEFGRPEIVQILLEDGRIDPRDRDFKAMREAAKEHPYHGYNVDIVKMLLADPRVDPTQQGGGAYEPPLYYVKDSGIEIARLLLEDERVRNDKITLKNIYEKIKDKESQKAVADMIQKIILS